MSTDIPESFLSTLQQYYIDFGRNDMAWRQSEPDGSFDPYKILVSELMLQQTQVKRVEPKFHDFLKHFPTLSHLADAQLYEVLRLWSGLGYNRRAKYLWQAAGTIVAEFDSVFPCTLTELIRLPGVGPNTAGAIMAYAYDQPVVYVETNIRTVIIHHFFGDETNISDQAIRGVLGPLLASQNNRSLSPREFYWAMMDYGAHLKLTVGNRSTASETYTKQSKFEGSRRQVRGRVIRLLAERAHTATELNEQLADERTVLVLYDLVTEGMVKQAHDLYYLA